MKKKKENMNRSNEKYTYEHEEDKIPIAINGIMNLAWLKEEAKKMTPEKEQAILLKNRAMSHIPIDECREWSEKHPIEEFMEKPKEPSKPNKKETFTREYVLTNDQLRAAFPLGSIHTIDDKECKVLGIQSPMKSNGAFASFPMVEFEVIGKQPSIDLETDGLDLD